MDKLLADDAIQQGRRRFPQLTAILARARHAWAATEHEGLEASARDRGFLALADAIAEAGLRERWLAEWWSIYGKG